MAVESISLMKKLPFLFLGPLSLAAICQAQPAVTIYNQNFGTVRDMVPLDLKAGINDVRFSETTAHVETDSVILRDPRGAVALRILEQNYRNDPVSAGLLLSLNEGKVIDFFVRGSEGRPDRTVKGKIICSGYTPHSDAAMQRYGNRYYQGQMVMNQGMTPIIEVEGQLMFSLPGEPRFPSLADDTVLKPTLMWRLHAEKAAKLDAEIAYVTGGMSWEAAYNVTSPEKGDILDLSGWVTMDNQSGKTFTEAKVQLVAGDVAKLEGNDPRTADPFATRAAGFAASPAPQVTEKAFDEYHLYSLPLPTTLHDRETKQVEFVRASGVKAERIYVYDGVKVDVNRYGTYNMYNVRDQEEYGTESNPKVAVMREIKNSEANHLGLPLPRGKVRFYRQDDEGQAQFVGENLIDHTPKDETLRIYTGNAFDLAGERKRTNFSRDNANHWVDETFEIKLRNHKKEAVEVRVVEHLYRWNNWEIKQSSAVHLKTDAQTMEFRTPLKPDEERTITYTVHYSW
ncbi:MAG: hypothetical protein JWO08_3610 [Verrucomicrobiaceae bacterium]|nr:hypothetical protein [Verrucomicrobiaceae bacterium]